MKENGLQKILEQLSNERIWPDPNKSMCEFEKLALNEFKLAARMDCLACRRALVGKKLRNGHKTGQVELKKLASETQDVTDDFKKLWLLRNKPSRLRDNLNLFKKAERELEHLAHT